MYKNNCPNKKTFYSLSLFKKITLSFLYAGICGSVLVCVCVCAGVKRERERVSEIMKREKKIKNLRIKDGVCYECTSDVCI